MSRIFVKGNNFFRQLGFQNKLKQIDWEPLDLSAKLLNGNNTLISKVEANQGQTCILTHEGSFGLSGQVVIWGWNFDNRAMSKVAMYYKRFPLFFTMLQVGWTKPANPTNRRHALLEEFLCRTNQRAATEPARLQRLRFRVRPLVVEECRRSIVRHGRQQIWPVRH